MSMEILIKAAAICIVSSLLALVLQRNTPEIALLLSLAAVAAVMGWAFSLVSEIGQLWQVLLERTNLDGVLFVPLGKIIAISILTRLAGDICRDSGQKALSSAVELTGTLGALVAAVPLVKEAMNLLMRLG